MMKSTYLLLLLIHVNYFVSAQISLSRVFSNHMVLQRNCNIPVWGKAKKGVEVVVEFANTRTFAKVDESGKWMVHLPQFEAGGPYKLIIYEKDNNSSKVEFDDIMIGDVWLASGQSNMEWQVQQSKDAGIEIPKANYPDIRFFLVPHDKSLKPESDFKGGSWNICDSNSVKTLSAVAYYFSRELHNDLNIPVGILQATWGGTPIEAWTSREMLLSSPISKERVLDQDTLTQFHFIKDSLDLITFWDIVFNVKNETDKTIPQNEYDDSKWTEIEMPKTFKDWDIPFYEGMVWLRKKVTIPETFVGKDLTINLGHPEMNYSLYFNGNEICKTLWNANLTHFYSIPSSLVKSGENMITVRMALLWGGGGFNPPAEHMFLSDGSTKISLAGNWKYQKDLEPAIPKIYNFHYFPSFVFNSMINPIIPYGIKGFLWYQGEADDFEANYYRIRFPMLISDWRIRWQQGYLPFLYVQLPNYKKQLPEPSESEWAELREAQTLTLSQPNTGMACIIELGDPDNIHPINKQEVGHRLVLVAKKAVYGINCVATGPVYSGFQVESNSIRIRFTNTNSGLALRDTDTLKGFAIAGIDKRYYWATAHIVGEEIIVSSDMVKNPVAVRYNWADNPDGNLINTEGLPALPFRTDNWKGITEK